MNRTMAFTGLASLLVTGMALAQQGTDFSTVEIRTTRHSENLVNTHLRQQPGRPRCPTRIPAPDAQVVTTVTLSAFAARNLSFAIA